jgi:hypothetical protein
VSGKTYDVLGDACELAGISRGHARVVNCGAGGGRVNARQELEAPARVALVEAAVQAASCAAGLDALGFVRAQKRMTRAAARLGGDPLRARAEFVAGGGSRREAVELWPLEGRA